MQSLAEDKVQPLENIQNVINNFQPEDFISYNDRVSSEALKLLKTLYDFTKVIEQSAENGISSCNIKYKNSTANQNKIRGKKLGVSKTEVPLESLITEEFGEDQIWEEIQLQNVMMYEHLVSSISKVLAHQNHQSVLPDDDSEDIEHTGNKKDIEYYDEDESDDDKTERKKKSSRKIKTRVYPKSVVDDKFFNLAQMTEFLEKVETNIELKRNSDINPREREDNSNSEDDDESIDLFDDIDDESEVDEEEDSHNVYYNDFFDEPLNQDDAAGTNHETSDKSIRLNLNEDVQEENEFGNDNEVESEADGEGDSEIELEVDKDITESQNKDTSIKNKLVENLSNFEKRSKKIEENIEMMEEEALQPKAWHLLGEVTAVNRPENSLLERPLTYDHLVKQAPEVTLKTTQNLDDIVKQRIKDQAYDNVQRKLKPIEDAPEFKKKVVLDAEKSKMSLAQIYEQEYIQKNKAEDGESEKDKQPEEHVKIERDMHKLFAKLDSLSNFHYTPKRPSAEIKIVTNLPSITLEEVAPVSVSDATLLAPQEIQDHAKGDIKGKTERTDTDRKRERRVKKKKQKLKRIAREEKSKLRGLGLRNIKLADNIVKSSSKTKDDTARQNVKELKSSKAFFAKLQEQVQTQVKDNLKKRKKSIPKELSAKKFKM